MRLLLDTHAILWMVADDPRLGDPQREMLQQADELLWSVASMWEIGIKLSLERADFRLGPGWARHIPEELTRNGIKRIQLEP
ncbi:MAG: type II toxin-antitoxin system VapC family toxin, partial [Haloferula sp.]